MRYIIINIGSRSKKYSYFEEHKQELSLEIEGNDNRSPSLFVDFIKNNLGEVNGENTVFVFRIVAPGKFFTEHRPIDKIYLKKLREAAIISPLHIKPTLKEISAISKKFPRYKFFAVSDSAYHSTIPEYAKTYAIPERLRGKYEIERQGYHGLSISSAISSIQEKFGEIPEKMIVCHLGGGTSVTAVLNGNSIDTSMGWTPIEGVPMAERSGSIDPGVLAFLSGKLKLTGSKLSNFLETKCGLEAISGVDKGDIRTLIENEKRVDEVGMRSRLALDVYIYSIKKEIGKMIAVLGGCDSIVLTGTVSHRSSIIRHKLVQGFGYLNIYLHEDNNWAAGEVHDLTPLGSPIDKSVIVVPANESLEIYKAVKDLSL